MPVGRPDFAGPDAPLLNIAARCFADETPSVVGVMVSGGGDSMALLHLFHRVGWQVSAITIDHGLRAEAPAEAAMVAAFCADHGISHQTSLWHHGDITGNLMDQARRARYQLAADWAQTRGIKHVVVGHTADDQAENFLIGLSRQAGLDGLCGMRPAWSDRGIRFSRPLLSVPRVELRDYLRRNAVTWVEDPTNDDDSFARVKARNALSSLRSMGITPAKLAAVSDNLHMARSAIQRQLNAAAQAVTQSEAAELVLSHADYTAMPLELQRRLLIGALRWMSGATYPPREKALMRVQGAIETGKDATLGGCQFRRKGNEIRIVREPKAAGGTCDLAHLWDGRWQVSGPIAAGLHLRALGVEGLRACKAWRMTGISRDALLVTPGVWRENTLIAAPLAGFAEGYDAKIVVNFNSFLLSH